jgi:hypothetical protein
LISGAALVVTSVALAGMSLNARSNDDALGPRLTVDRPVVELAADGTVAAAMLRSGTDDATSCGRIIAWDVRTRRVITAYTYDYCDIERVTELTAAGTRVAWVDVVEEGEISSALTLEVFDLGSRRRITVVNVWPDGISLSDARVGNIAGKGSLLVFNTWREYGPPSTWQLWRVDSHGKSPLHPGSGPMAAVDVDGNRILVQRADGHLALLKANGSTVRDFPFAPARAGGARLDGPTIVVETTKAIVIHDASTGRAVRTWSTIGLEDVEGGIAVARSADGIHLLRLADGHAATVPIRSVVAARLTRAGLFYATGSPSKTQLGFVPSSTVRARLR